MIWAALLGNYKMSKRSIGLLIFAIAYVLFPFEDILLSFLGPINIIDEALVIGYTIKVLSKESENFVLSKEDENLSSKEHSEVK